MGPGMFSSMEGCFWPAAICAVAGFVALVAGAIWMVLWLVEHVRFV